MGRPVFLYNSSLSRLLLRARRVEDLGMVGHALPVVRREVALPASELDLVESFAIKLG